MKRQSTPRAKAPTCRCAEEQAVRLITYCGERDRGA